MHTNLEMHIVMKDNFREVFTDEGEEGGDEGGEGEEVADAFI